jgi:hypothetical protein
VVDRARVVLGPAAGEQVRVTLHLGTVRHGPLPVHLGPARTDGECLGEGVDLEVGTAAATSRITEGMLMHRPAP